MKKQLFLISALLVLFSACSKDDDETIAINKNAKFTFNNNQIPQPADGVLITDADFDKYLKNKYFLEQSDGRRIEQDGNLSDKLFWEGMIGIGTDGYYFAADSAFNYVLYVDSNPNIKYIRNSCAYIDGRAVVSYPRDVEMPDLKIVKVNDAGFTAIRLIGVKGDGRPSYIYSSYRKVSESKFNKALE
ncbi:MAG: hypothetical protein J5651_01075 [Salinivirgaceae bacterium]|nr:hypothetical protein [Salinivirgaceae bacterium]